MSANVDAARVLPVVDAVGADNVVLLGLAPNNAADGVPTRYELDARANLRCFQLAWTTATRAWIAKENENELDEMYKYQFEGKKAQVIDDIQKTKGEKVTEQDVEEGMKAFPRSRKDGKNKAESHGGGAINSADNTARNYFLAGVAVGALCTVVALTIIYNASIIDRLLRGANNISLSI